MKAATLPPKGKKVGGLPVVSIPSSTKNRGRWTGVWCGVVCRSGYLAPKFVYSVSAAENVQNCCTSLGISEKRLKKEGNGYSWPCFLQLPNFRVILARIFCIVQLI